MTKILVTGGAGYIGSVMVQDLLEYGYEVTVVDNLMYGQAHSLFGVASHPDFKFVFGDITDQHLLYNLSKDADVIIPLAALVGAKLCDDNKDKAWDTNYAQVSYLARICRGTSKSLIIPTTNSGYGVGGKGECDENSPLNPISEYGKSKVAAEKEVLGVGGISLRLATVFGSSPRQRLDLLVNDFVWKAKRDGVIVLFEEHFRRNYIHIRDVCSAFMHCIDFYDELKGQAYNVGLSSANLTKRQLAEKIREHLPKTVIISSDIGEDPDKRDYLVSNAKFEGAGWWPAYTLDDGIKEMIKVYDMVKGAGDVYRNY